MSITKEQQQALNDALVPREQRLRIGNCNYRLSTTFKPKEPTFQVALDVLSLTPFYQAFLISASVPAIYMHEFWATVSYHKHCIKFKLNKKNHSFDLETFRDMLQICPNLPGQKFVDPPFEEEILAFIRELGYPGDIKSLSDVKVDTLHQPWRTFETIINKCLSGKVTRLDQLRLSRAQIIWGMYNQKNVDYVYLLWEDLVYQIKNKVSKKNKDMYCPRFTKVIINHFMSKDQSIPRRNKVDWNMAYDEPILTTIRFIPKHETVQKYGVILPDTLTNQAMKESDAYKSFHDFATGKVLPKPKYVQRSTMEKTEQAPTTSPGKRLKAIAKVAKSGKKKLHAQGLETLSEIALSEAEQMKIISWKSSDEDDDDEVSLSKDDDDNADNEDDDGLDDDNEQTESDNDGDDFVHPKFSTYDEEVRQDEEDKEEECLDMRVHTPSHFESTDDETYDEVTQGDNVKEEKMDEEQTNKEEEVNEMYNDVNINLEGRDTEMTDALLANVQTTQVIEDTHVIITVVTPEFKDRVKALEDDFSKFKQTNLFAEAVSSIPGIVNKYLANQMNEVVKVVVQLQSDRLRSEVQTEVQEEEELEKNPESKLSAPKEKLPIQLASLKNGYTEDQPINETTWSLDWFQKPAKPPTPNRDWNKTLPTAHGPIQPWISNLAWKEDPLNRESACDVYSRHRILTVTKHKIVECHNYKHLDWITVRRNDDMLYTFKEAENLNVEERLALGVSLRMFIRRIVLRRRVKDLQLGVESYQKKLNLTSDGTLNDVRSALDDIFKRIRMKYLPQNSLEKHQSDTQVITMKMEILLEPTSNKLMVDPYRFKGYPKPYSSPRFIANCFIADSHKDGHGELQERCNIKAFQVDKSRKVCLSLIEPKTETEHPLSP
ncbi:hypothetical protein Tco_1156109 [Tanacetum coccineum]